MKRLFVVLLCFCCLSANAQNYLLSTTDYKNDPQKFFDNFISIAREGVLTTASKIKQVYGDTVDIEKINDKNYEMFVYSYKLKSKFPLVRAIMKENNGTVYITKMRIPPGVDLNKFFIDNGFIYVSEKTDKDFKETIFDAKGSNNPLVALLYFDFMYQILDFKHQGKYIQTSFYVENKH